MYCLYRFLFKKIPYSKSAHNVNQNIKSSIAKGVSNQNGQSMSGIHGDGGLQNQHCVCSLVCVIKQIHQYVMWLRDFVFPPRWSFDTFILGLNMCLSGPLPMESLMNILEFGVYSTNYSSEIHIIPRIASRTLMLTNHI